MNIIDVIMIALIVLAALLSARRGLLLSFLNLISVIAGGVAAKFLSAPAADYIYTRYLQQGVTDKLYELMPSGSVAGEITQSINNVIDAFPEYIVSVARKFELIPDILTNSDPTAALSVENIEADYIAPIITGVAAIITSVVIFFVVSAILKLVAYYINKAVVGDKHKTLKNINMFFGGLLGLVKGVIPAGIICAVLNLIAPAIDSPTFVNAVDTSYFCNLITEFIN